MEERQDVADMSAQPKAGTTPAQTKAGHKPARFRSNSLTSVLEKSGIPIFLAALIILFCVDSTTGAEFRSSANLENIFANQSVTGLVAIATVIPLVTGNFDLQVAAVAGLANVTFATLSGTHHDPVIVGIIGALVVAVLAGAITGALVAFLKLSSFICTFGTYIFIGGLLQLYTKGNTVGTTLPVSVGQFASEKWLGIARPFWILMIVAVIAWYLLTQTPYGRKLAAIGSNEAAARLAGIRVDRALFLTFLLSGLLGGVAGVLLTSQTGGADATTGTSYLFPAMAGVFLGQTAIRPGQPNVWGTMFGVFLVAVAVDGLTLMGAQSWVQQVFNGGALVLGVTFSTLMRRVRDRRARQAVLVARRETTSDSASPRPPMGAQATTAT
jgi:ribose transport system permease protein